LTSKFKHQLHRSALKNPVWCFFALAPQKAFSLFRIFFQGISGILIKKTPLSEGLGL